MSYFPYTEHVNCRCVLIPVTKESLPVIVELFLQYLLREDV